MYFRVQQEERDQPLPVLAESVGETIEVQTASTSRTPRSRSKSPRPKIFNKKESKSKSNSSTLNVRRFSNDSILEDRLGSIGRRLSRDITDSPPDLVHRFETFGKGSVPDTSIISKYDTFAGTTQPVETNSVDGLNKYDTFSGITETKPDIPLKKGRKYQSKRTPLNLDIYEKDRYINDTLSMSDNLYPPIFKLDRTKAILRSRVHEELKSKYPAERSYIVKRPKNSNVEHIYATCKKKPAPPQQQKQNATQTQSTTTTTSSMGRERTSSTHSREHHSGNKHHSANKYLSDQPPPLPPAPNIVPPVPNIRVSSSSISKSRNSLEVPPKLPPKTSPRTRNMNFSKLSREDLLKLSQSSEKEIQRFLQQDRSHPHT